MLVRRRARFRPPAKLLRKVSKVLPCITHHSSLSLRELAGTLANFRSSAHHTGSNNNPRAQLKDDVPGAPYRPGNRHSPGVLDPSRYRRGCINENRSFPSHSATSRARQVRHVLCCRYPGSTYRKPPCLATVSDVHEPARAGDTARCAGGGDDAHRPRCHSLDELLRALQRRAAVRFSRPYFRRASWMERGHV